MREFGSLAAFAEHLAVLSVTVVQAEQKALDAVARMVEHSAKEAIGEYQQAVGPFPEWSPLAESTEQEKARLGYPLASPLLRDGTLRGSIQREVRGLEAVIGSKSDIAAYQEFGTDKIPPRPFIGPAAFRNAEKIQRILGEATVAGLSGGVAINRALGYDFETK